jgi:hypothetical protein
MRTGGAAPTSISRSKFPRERTTLGFAFDIPWSGAAQALSVRIRVSCRRIKATDIKARCTPKYSPDTHLIKTQRHMHARGVRLNGSRETLIDVPYDFNNQITYETGMVLKPEDFLVTNCHFEDDTAALSRKDRAVRKKCA